MPDSPDAKPLAASSGRFLFFWGPGEHCSWAPYIVACCLMRSFRSLRAQIERLLKRSSACREYVHTVQFLVCPQGCEWVSKTHSLVVSSLIAATKSTVGLAARCAFNFLTVPCGVTPAIGELRRHCQTIFKMVPAEEVALSNCKSLDFGCCQLIEQRSSLPIDCDVIFLHGILNCSWQLS